MPRCRDCKLYDLDAVKSKSGAVLRNRVGKCLWVSTEVWPEHVESGASRATGGYAEPNTHHRCQRFIKRQEKK